MRGTPANKGVQQFRDRN